MIPKKELPVFLRRTWEDFSPTVMESGSRKAGIVRYNRNVTEESVSDPKALYRWKEADTRKEHMKTIVTREQRIETEKKERTKN